MTKQKCIWNYIYISKDVLLGEKTILCLQWWTQSNLKELQNNYAQNWSEFVNSKRECQLVRPHILAQSNGVLLSNNFNWSHDLSTSLKV